MITKLYLIPWLLFVPGADSHANLYSCNAATVFPFVVAGEEGEGEEEEEEEEEEEAEEDDDDDDDEPFEGTNFESVIIAPFVPRSHEAEEGHFLGPPNNSGREKSGSAT